MNYAELTTAIETTCATTFETDVMATFVQQAEQKIYSTVDLPASVVNTTLALTLGNRFLNMPARLLYVYSMAVVNDSMYEFLLNKDPAFIREAYPNNAVSSRGLPKHYAIFGPNSTNTTELSFLVGPSPNLAYSVELHFYYLPESIVQAALSRIDIQNGGAGYANGIYFNVPLTGGGGNSATANITVVSGVVVSATLSNRGCFYAAGNTLSVSNSNLGGSGSGLVLTVTTVTNAGGTTWLGDNFDTALFNGVMMEAIRFMKGDPDLVALYQQQFTQSLALLKNLGDGKQRMDAYRDGQVRVQVN